MDRRPIFSRRELARVRDRMGWDKIRWNKPFIELPAGYEIDFGGICKEYAADRILVQLKQRNAVSALGQSSAAISPFPGRRLWSVGIEDVSRPGQGGSYAASAPGGHRHQRHHEALR